MTVLRKHTRHDDGLSIIEVMVAIMLFSILTLALASTSILGLRTSSGLGIRLDNATQGQVGVAAVSKILRTAVLPDQLSDQICVGCADTAIVQATRSQLSFYANLNNTGNGPSLVTLQIIKDPYRTNTSMLQQSLQPPTVLPDGRYTFCNPSTAGCVVQKRVLTRGLKFPVDTAFGYFDFDGELITSPILSAEDLARVSSVDVVLTVNTVPGQTRTPATTALTRVRLPNADINVLVQPEGT